jgi:hypothetical protein
MNDATIKIKMVGMKEFIRDCKRARIELRKIRREQLKLLGLWGKKRK